jgi:hypothetical protein
MTLEWRIPPLSICRPPIKNKKIVMNKSRFIFFILAMALSVSSNAQDSSKLYFTTAAGLFSPVSSFSNAYRNSLALNSGIEYRFSPHYFTQFVLDFNAVKYDQQIRDASSAYLFQQTNSSVFFAGLNVGRNIPINRSGRLFISPYLGVGYANIGEPRLTVKNNTGIIEQEVTRMKGVFAREGLRIAYRTKSKVLQTLYFDASYLSANVNVQNSKPKSLSLLVGTRFGF